MSLDRLEKLKILESTLFASLQDAAYNELPSLAKQYRDTLREIEALEGRLNEIDREMSDSADDYKKLQELSEEREDVEKQLEEKTERWVYLNELAEKIDNQ